MMFAVSVGAVVALAIFLGADMISRHLMESPLSVYTLKVLAPALFIVAVLGVMRGYFQGMGTMVPTAISQVLEQIINATVNIVGASIMIKVGMAAAKSRTILCLNRPMGQQEERWERLREHWSHCCFDVCVCTVSKSDDAADEKRPHETSGWIWADFEGSSFDDRPDPVQYGNL